MKIPTNMTEEEALTKIKLVIDRIAPRYTFNGYDVEDIKQEAFIICVDALERYDNNRPLENFLSVHLSNRLKNFVRDNFGNAKDVSKKKVLSPVQFSSENQILDKYYEIDTDNIDTRQLMQQIEESLPINMREDYLKLINGVNLSKIKKNILLKKIQEIIHEKG